MDGDDEDACSARPCVCCGFLTMSPGLGNLEICPVCSWHDDEIQSEEPDFVGGPNKVCLNQARRNFAEFGAKTLERLRYVRDPKPHEIPRKD